MTATFNGVFDSVGDANITFFYQNDNYAFYDFSAGTKNFGVDNLEDPVCAVQEVTVTISAVEFNTKTGISIVKQDGVLNAIMSYSENTDPNAEGNTCTPEPSAQMKLEYEYFDCGTE
jgi:hypothetical protein